MFVPVLETVGGLRGNDVKIPNKLSLRESNNGEVCTSSFCLYLYVTPRSTLQRILEIYGTHNIN